MKSKAVVYIKQIGGPLLFWTRTLSQIHQDSFNLTNFWGLQLSSHQALMLMREKGLSQAHPLQDLDRFSNIAISLKLSYLSCITGIKKPND